MRSRWWRNRSRRWEATCHTMPSPTGHLLPWPFLAGLGEGREWNLSSQPLPSLKVCAASTRQKMTHRRPKRGVQLCKSKVLWGLTWVCFGPTSVSGCLLWTLKRETLAVGPSATRGQCVLSLWRQKVHRLQFHTSQTGSVVGALSLYVGPGVWPHLLRNGKSSKALQQESGIIKCVFWEANRVKVREERLKARATGQGLLRVQWGTSVLLGPSASYTLHFLMTPVYLSATPHWAKHWTVGAMVNLKFLTSLSSSFSFLSKWYIIYPGA